ncbi:MAG: CHAD domain-containing protein, partial [Betaproteobacteria bacterium]
EIEIKLAIGAGHAARLWRALGRFPHQRPSTQRLFSAYYDTPEFRLHSSGVALRLRREGQRWIQAVKGATSASGGLHRCTGHETPVAAQLPDFPAVAQAGYGALVADRHTRDALRVIFTTRFRRTSALFERDGQSIVEVSLDRGAISAGGRHESICEIELRLRAGNASALFELASEMVRQMPVRLDNRSKAERGYALAASADAAPVRAAASRLTRQMTIEQAFANVAFDCIAHLQANEAGLLAGRDPEYLHQARVALRRLRSACRIFGTVIPRRMMAQTQDQIKAISRLLGNARNCDVFSVETLAHADAADHAGIAAVRRRAQMLRRQAGREARAAVAASAYTIMLLQFAQKLFELQTQPQPGAAPVPRPRLEDFAAGVLSQLHASVKKRGRHIEQLAFPELHRLRIEIKRLRYASDFFLPLAPRKADDALQSLGALQGLLGRLNDDAVAWRLLDTLATADASADYQQAIGYERGWCARDGELCRGMLEQAWKTFGKHKAWWRWS